MIISPPASAVTSSFATSSTVGFLTSKVSSRIPSGRPCIVATDLQINRVNRQSYKKRARSELHTDRVSRL